MVQSLPFTEPPRKYDTLKARSFVCPKAAVFSREYNIPPPSHFVFSTYTSGRSEMPSASGDSTLRQHVLVRILVSYARDPIII